LVELCRAEQQITREIFAKGESRAKQKNAKEPPSPSPKPLWASFDKTENLFP